MSDQIQSFLLLTVLSLTYSHSIRRVEKLRRAVVLDRIPDMLGLWTFAGVMLLPPSLIVALVIVVNLGEWPSRRAVGNGRPFKYAVSTAGTAASCVAASYVLHHPALGAFNVPTAVLTFWALNLGIVAILIRASGRRNVWRMVSAVPHVQLVEIGTQFLGAGLGLAMITWHPLTGIGALVMLYVLHLASARHVVEVTESFDPVTGLWSEEAWMVQAQQKLQDVYGHVALYMIDPDEAGQEVRILQTIESGLQPSDLLGRYGSRQILVLIPVGRAEGGPFLGAGFRKDLAAAGIRATLGCATTADAELEGLLIEAMSDVMGRRAAAGITRNW